MEEFPKFRLASSLTYMNAYEGDVGVRTLNSGVVLKIKVNPFVVG